MMMQRVLTGAGIGLCLMLAACGGADETAYLEVWAHAGQQAERDVLKAQVDRFNRQSPVEARLTFIPERDYNAQIQAAALAGDLPDVLEFDGPYLFNYIWQNQLRPLDDGLPAAIADDLLPSIVTQGTHNGKLYGVGVFDSGLGLYARPSRLRAAGVRIPEGVDDAWTIAEFNAALANLAARDADGAVLDLKLNYPGEWFTYGFAPVLYSAGAGLIGEDHQSSDGVLNAPAAVTALRHVQNWIVTDRVDPNLDDAAFVDGRVALSWVGHWEYGRYHAAFGDDLVVVPLPDFGEGSRTGQGSWVWGVPRDTARAGAALDWIAFLLQTDEVLAMSNANGAVPARRSAVERSELYGPQGDLRLFAEQLQHGHAVPRPRTPGYPAITTAFQQAFQQIRNGGAVEAALESAVLAIDRDIRDNRGYPFTEGQ